MLLQTFIQQAQVVISAFVEAFEVQKGRGLGHTSIVSWDRVRSWGFGVGFLPSLHRAPFLT